MLAAGALTSRIAVLVAVSLVTKLAAKLTSVRFFANGSLSLINRWDHEEDRYLAAIESGTLGLIFE